MNVDDDEAAAARRVEQAREAMVRAVEMTAAIRDESRVTYNLAVIRLRMASRRACELCSGRAQVADCSCKVRCLFRRCAGPLLPGEIDENEESTIP